MLFAIFKRRNRIMFNNPSSFGNFTGFGVGTTLSQFQNRVIGPTEIVPYSDIVQQAYPPQAIAMEAFIGVKILVRDTQASRGTPAQRMEYLDKYLPQIVTNNGILIRETNNNVMIDGFWIITLPVPKSQLKDQLNKLGHVLTILENNFGIVYQDIIDINISGRCPLIYTEQALSQVVIPKMYQQYMMQTDNSPYKIGYPIRINDEYVLLKTRWGLPRQDMFENITVIESCIQNMFK